MDDRKTLLEKQVVDALRNLYRSPDDHLGIMSYLDRLQVYHDSVKQLVQHLLSTVRRS